MVISAQQAEKLQQISWIQESLHQGKRRPIEGRRMFLCGARDSEERKVKSEECKVKSNEMAGEGRSATVGQIPVSSVAVLLP